VTESVVQKHAVDTRGFLDPSKSTVGPMSEYFFE